MSSLSPWSKLFLTVAVLLGVQTPVEAIIHAEGEGSEQASESALLSRVASWGGGVAFPFWKNIGQIERSTGIYMGNGYVLTAAHVGPGPFRTGDGRIYPALAQPVTYFRNFDDSQADLCLFRVQVTSSDPLASYPVIPLTTMPPRKGTALILIGGGAGSKSSGKRFAWSDDYRVRWGLNTIEKVYSVTMPTSRYASFGFGTRFERTGGHCQAAPGDSGGAAFHFNPSSKRWELAGVIVAVDSRFGGAEFGNQTYIADPALFRRELAVSRQGLETMLASRP